MEDALAAAPGRAGGARSVAIEPGAPAKVKVDVGRSLMWVGILLQVTGKRVEGLATLRRSESLLAALAMDDPEAREAGVLPHNDRPAPDRNGRVSKNRWRLTRGRGRIRRR